MEHIFKVGDVVRFNPERIKNLRTVSPNKDYVVVEVDAGLVRIIRDNMEVGGFFANRFLPLQPVAPIEIAANKWVKAIRDVGVSIKKDKVYHVERIKGEGKYVKIKGIGNAICASSFVLCDAPAEVTGKGENLLIELAKRVGINVGRCSYVLSFTDGTKSYHIKDVCHARLCNGNNKGKIVDFVALNVSGHYKTHSDKEAYKEFVQYITQESPFKECFLPRKLEDILDTGVLLDVSKPYSRCVASAVALRVGSEHPKQAILFKKVIDLGFSKEVALILSGFFDDNPESVKYNGNGGGHHFLSQDMSVEDLALFMEKGFHRDLKEKSYVDDCEKTYTIGFAIADRQYGKDGYGNIDNFKKETMDNFIKKLKGIEKVNGGWSSSSAFTGKNALTKCAAALCKTF